MKRTIFILLAIFLYLSYSTIFAQTVDNAFRMEEQESESDYQKYVGKRIRFREALGTLERDFKIKADTSVDYIINSIILKPHKDTEVHIVFRPISGGKPITVIAYNNLTTYRKKTCLVSQIPLIFMDEYESVKDENVGVIFELPNDKQEYKILEMGFGSINNSNVTIARSDYKTVNVKKGNILYFSAIYINKVLSGEITKSPQADKLIDGAAFNQEFALFSQLSSKNIKTWADGIYQKEKRDADKNIFYQYVIPINDTTKVGNIAAYAEQWLNNRDKFRFITQHADFNNDKVPTIKSTIKLDFVLRHLYLVSAKFTNIYENVHGYADVIVEIKPSRLRITVTASEYDITYSGDGLNDVTDDTRKNLSPSRTPIKLHAPHFIDKPVDFWNEAYVKTNVCCMNTISELINYINSSYDESTSRKEKEEKRLNEDW